MFPIHDNDFNPILYLKAHLENSMMSLVSWVVILGSLFLFKSNATFPTRYQPWHSTCMNFQARVAGG